MALFAQDEEKKFSTKEIAATLQRSENHLSKVLQRLTRAGFILSIRGPQGGFRLRDGWAETAFLDIYELPKESDPEPVFQGWMFASSPALNAMEHPVFDVWLLDCKN